MRIEDLFQNATPLIKSPNAIMFSSDVDTWTQVLLDGGLVRAVIAPKTLDGMMACIDVLKPKIVIVVASHYGTYISFFFSSPFFACV